MTAHRRCLLVLGLLLATAPLWLAACSSESTTEPPPPPDPPTVREVVESTGWFPVVLPDSSGYAVARFDSLADPADLACTEFVGREVVAAPALTLLDAAPERHWPGAILQWVTAQQLVPAPVVADRAGGLVRLTAPGGGEYTGAVSVLDPDTLAAWRLDALSRLGPVPLADWQISVDAIHGQDHLALSAGVAPAGMPAAAEQRLAPRSGPFGRVLVRLLRPHHTVEAPYPGTIAGAFADTVNGGDLTDQMAEGNPPIWLDGVTHGQLILLTVEARAVFDEVAAAAAASFPPLAAGELPDPGTPSVWDLPEVEFRAFAVGADADAVEAAALAGPGELQALLSTGVQDPATLPAVQATVLALRNGGPLTLPLEAEFPYVTCEEAPDVFSQVLWRLAAADARVERRAGDLRSNAQGRYYYDGGTEQFVQDEVISLPDLDGAGGTARPGTRRPFLHRDLLPGHPVLEFYQLPLPQGTLHSELTFNGTNTVGRSYTIFLVCAQPENIRLRYTTPNGERSLGGFNEANYIIHGSDDGILRNLLVGYSRRGVMVFSHQPDRVEFPHEASAEFRVYAFRFSLESGMTVFADGEILDQDPTDNRALQALPGATLTARWFGNGAPDLATVWVAEVVAYNGAGSDAQVIAEIERLRAFYGLDR